MNTVNTVLTIVSTHRPGDTIFCRVTGVIIGSTNIMSTSLLTVVGLNLVLIFVFKVEQTHLLERFYYPAAVVYTVIGTVGPIYQEVTETPLGMDQYSCWYYMNIEDRTHSIFSWVKWRHFYFLFFIYSSCFFFSIDRCGFIVFYFSQILLLFYVQLQQ
jgi:hypothetical protein